MILVCISVYLTLESGLGLLLQVRGTATKAPYVPVPHETVQALLDVCQPEANNVIYELGSGDARILSALWNTYPNAQYIGIELNSIVYFKSRFLTRHHGQNFVLKRKNFMNEDLSKATHIICYLYPEVMDLLYPKFKKELNNTTVYSIDFPMKAMNPTEIITLKTDTRRGNTVYLYRC